MKGTSIVSMILLFFVVSPLFAYDSLEKTAPVLYAAPIVLEKEKNFTLLIRDKMGTIEKKTGKSVSTINPDGSFTLETSDGESVSRDLFNKTGRLISSYRETMPGKKSLSIDVSPDRKKATFVTMENGKEASCRTIGVKPANMFSPELRFLIHQAIAAGQMDGISVKGFSPDGAAEADMDIKLTRTNSPLSLNDAYAYPDEFKALFPPSETFIVGDMYLTGIAAMFYPHHNLFAFRKTETGVEFIAYWGGDPKEAVFQFFAKKSS